MKKKLILATLIIVFIAIVIISSVLLINHFNNDNSSKDNEVDNANDTEIEFLFELCKNELVLCKGKTGINVDYEVTDNVKYTLEITSDNLNICSVDNLILNPINVGSCKIEYKCIFDNENIITDDLIVTVIEAVETISVEVDSIDINNFNIKITTDKLPLVNSLSIACDDSVVISNINYNNNLFAFTATIYHLEENILVKYKNISDNFNNEINYTIELIEDISFIEYSTNIELINNKYNIYCFNLLYSQDANLDNITNILVFTINKGVHDNVEYKLIASNDSVSINGLSVIANCEGETTVSLYCNDVLIDTVNVVVGKITPTSVTFVNDLTLNIGDTVSVEPINILPNYSLHIINYAILSGNEYIELNNGMITALKSGTCKLLITVNDFSKEITIIIPEQLSYELKLLDLNYNTIDSSLCLSQNINFIFYSINTNGLPKVNIKVVNNNTNLIIELYSDYIIINIVESGEYKIDFYIAETNTYLRSILLIKT